MLMLANSKDANFCPIPGLDNPIYGKWIGQDKKLMCLNIIAPWEQTMLKKD